MNASRFAPIMGHTCVLAQACPRRYTASDGKGRELSFSVQHSGSAVRQAVNRVVCLKQQPIGREVAAAVLMPRQCASASRQHPRWPAPFQPALLPPGRLVVAITPEACVASSELQPPALKCCL
jgi:hypothetical protein